MQFTIVKKFGPFAASHYLNGVPEGHQCGRSHGHNYEVEVELSTNELDETGFVVDYGELKPLSAYLTSRMDHRNLNEQFTFNPTAENIALHIFRWIEGTTDWPLVAVRVSETPGKTMSECRRDPAPAQIVWADHSRTQIHETVVYNIDVDVRGLVRDSLLDSLL